MLALHGQLKCKCCEPGQRKPKGACCFPDGTCTYPMTLAQCNHVNGTWQGDNTNCTPNLCPQPGPCPANQVPCPSTVFVSFSGANLCTGSAPNISQLPTDGSGNISITQNSPPIYSGVLIPSGMSGPICVTNGIGSAAVLGLGCGFDPGAGVFIWSLNLSIGCTGGAGTSVRAAYRKLNSGACGVRGVYDFYQFTFSQGLTVFSCGTNGDLCCTTVHCDTPHCFPATVTVS